MFIRFHLSGDSITYPFGLHAPECSNFWCLIRLVRVPLTFTYRYFQTFVVQTNGLPCTRYAGFQVLVCSDYWRLLFAFHAFQSVTFTCVPIWSAFWRLLRIIRVLLAFRYWYVGSLVPSLLRTRPIGFCLVNLMVWEWDVSCRIFHPLSEISGLLTSTWSCYEYAFTYFQGGLVLWDPIDAVEALCFIAITPFVASTGFIACLNERPLPFLSESIRRTASN